MAHQAHVGYRDLRGYLGLLESAGLLRRVEAEVDLKHELGAICVKSLSMDGPGLLFENIRGYRGSSLVANILSAPAHLAIAFGTEADEWKITETVGAGRLTAFRREWCLVDRARKRSISTRRRMSTSSRPPGSTSVTADNTWGPRLA